MSATSLDIITDAYRVLTIVDETANPTAEQTQVGLTVLNDMMANIQADGIRVGWYPQTAAQLTMTAPLKDQDIRNIKLMFVGELAIRWGIDLTAERPDLKDRIDSAIMAQTKRSIEYFESDLTGLPFSQGGLFGPGRI